MACFCRKFTPIRCRIVHRWLIGFLVCNRLRTVTTSEIIEEIARLPSNEKAQVLNALLRSQTEKGMLTPEELVALADQMVAAKDPEEADRLQKQILAGFYGRWPMPRIRRKRIPDALMAHLIKRVREREISTSQLGLLARWLDTGARGSGRSLVQTIPWNDRLCWTRMEPRGCERHGRDRPRGRSEREWTSQLVKTFLTSDQLPTGEEIKWSAHGGVRYLAHWLFVDPTGDFARIISRLCCMVNNRWNERSAKERPRVSRCHRQEGWTRQSPRADALACKTNGRDSRSETRGFKRREAVASAWPQTVKAQVTKSDPS